MRLRGIKDSKDGMVDLGVVLMIGIAFAALMVIAYIIFTVRDQLLPQGAYQNNSYFQNLTLSEGVDYNVTWNSIRNVTVGFDAAISLMLVAITIFILAIAIGALLMLRGR